MDNGTPANITIEEYKEYKRLAELALQEKNAKNPESQNWQWNPEKNESEPIDEFPMYTVEHGGEGRIINQKRNNLMVKIGVIIIMIGMFIMGVGVGIMFG